MEEVEIVWKDETEKTKGERHFKHVQTIFRLSITTRNKGKTFDIHHKDTETMRSYIIGCLSREMVKGFLLGFDTIGMENVKTLYRWK